MTSSIERIRWSDLFDTFSSLLFNFAFHLWSQANFVYPIDLGHHSFLLALYFGPQLGRSFVFRPGPDLL